ncbi:hypothetical protein EV144_101244 [Flavobacterium sp. 270]|uniref:hypothetical protein n=1 Tax=Flavobacterium sp. 270 TaxID=2512114 RepID=UPI00106630DB|nr:hypothetical protein [Flavobacterium sp. 270]TDW51568.1 hypothetical protein EV144_101244 [Flavobacterium sp. 270]
MKSKLSEIQKEFKSNPVLFIRENLSLIIIVPTLLGGLWQVVELSRLSFSFLRFFSISQIVPDGLLIIIVTIIILLVFLFYIKILKVEDAEKINENDKFLKEHFERKRPFSIYIIVFLILIYCTIIIFNLIAIYKFKINSIFDLIMTILFTIMVSTIAFSIIELASIRARSEYKENISILKGLITIPLLFTCYSLLIGFHDMYIFPKELTNMENIKCYVENSKNVNVKIKIKYLNDKYIFLDVTQYDFKENKTDTLFFPSKYQIISFETILDESSCLTLRKEKLRIQDSIKFRIQQNELRAKKNLILLDSINSAK